MDSIISEKVNQVVDILRELDIDLWLTFVQETSVGSDPVLPFIYGHTLTWQSALMIAKSGERIAIVGSLENETATRTGIYSQVIPYHEAIRPVLLETLERLSPKNIAINYSKNNTHADGLSHGLFLILKDYLSDTVWGKELISAERIIAALRGRKTPSEIARIQKAINTTDQIYEELFAYVKPGMSERQIASFMQDQLSKYSVEPAWEMDHCPTVNAGPDSPVGHVGPTDIIIRPGQLLHIDFGVKEDEYCSDIQRMVYFLAPGETRPPTPVQRGFDVIVKAIQTAVAAMKPGAIGKEVDAQARRVVLEAGYPEYKYATGHQLGRLAHDGAGLLGPEWERYGDTPNYPLEANQVFTVEPGLMVEGYGYIGLEEDVIITKTGAEFLGDPQTKLVIIGG